MKTYQFKCPKCKGHRLEEVMINVTVASEVSNVCIEDDCVDMDYGHQSSEDGDVERYQCIDCGEVVAGSQEELISFFEKKKKRKKTS